MLQALGYFSLSWRKNSKKSFASALSCQESCWDFMGSKWPTLKDLFLLLRAEWPLRTTHWGRAFRSCFAEGDKAQTGKGKTNLSSLARCCVTAQCCNIPTSFPWSAGYLPGQPLAIRTSPPLSDHREANLASNLARPPHLPARRSELLCKNAKSEARQKFSEFQALDQQQRWCKVWSQLLWWSACGPTVNWKRSSFEKDINKSLECVFIYCLTLFAWWIHALTWLLA